MCALTLFDIPGVFALSAMAESNIAYSFRAYGDSIAEGYGLTNSSESYPEVFAQPYISNLGGNVENHGVSGDTSSNLVEDLQGYINKTASDYSDFLNTDFFTLCIGANNVLGPAMNNLSGSLSDEEYRAVLQAGVDQFESDYLNSILPCLTQNSDAKVYVMTIYNPYKHTTANDIQVNTGNTYFDSMVLTALQNVQTMLETTIEYLQDINDIIRASASDNVIVVDIYNLFETFTKDQYLQYINADLSKISITSMEDINNINALFSQYGDPHPTAQGHKTIAQAHIEKLSLLKLEMLTNLDNITADEDLVMFKLTQAGGGAYNFKFYKNDGTKSQFDTNISLTLDSTYSGNTTFYIQAEELIGEGVLYVESTLNNAIIAKSNEVAYSYQSKAVVEPEEPVEPETPTTPTDPVEPENPTQPEDDKQDTTKDKELTSKIVIVAEVAIFAVAILIGCFKL